MPTQHRPPEGTKKERKLAKSKIITISGGYHDVDELRVRVPADADINDSVDLECAVSVSTWARIQRHCCGIPSCCCGGVSRCYMSED